MNKVISISSPVYNGVETIDRAVESVLKQSFRDWELLCVDDGSTDGGQERLSYWSEIDRRIRVFRNETNRGPGAARNEAVRRSSGDTVVYLDCDDEFHPDYLEQVNRLRDNAEVIFFGYDYIVDSDKPNHIHQWRPNSVRHLLFEQNITTPLGVAHRKDLWEKVGGFNESLWCQEDWDFWKKLARTGADFLFVTMRSGIYHFRKGSRSDSPRITDEQRVCYESNWNSGVSLYGTAHQYQSYRTIQKVLFAANFSLLDRSSDKISIISKTMKLVSQSGFICHAFCRMRGRLGHHIESDLDRMKFQHDGRDSIVGNHRAKINITSIGDVPVTLVQPLAPLGIDRECEEDLAFLTFYEKFLDSYQPDVLMSHCLNPSLDPIVRLARRRDIPIVFTMLDEPFQDRTVFHHVDYCVVNSMESRRHYWESMGLACVYLPHPVENPSSVIEYGDFFRSVHPQPGPPYIPCTRSKRPNNDRIQIS